MLIMRGDKKRVIVLDRRSAMAKSRMRLLKRKVLIIFSHINLIIILCPENADREII